MRISKKLAALGAFFILMAAAVAGCGGSSNSVGSGSVANVAGNPISMKAWKHWTYIYAKGEAAQEASQGQSFPAVVPDPPNYVACSKELQSTSSFASDTDAFLKTTCQKIFAQTQQTIMPFLIAGYWYQALAHKLGVGPTDAQVSKAVHTYLSSHFKTQAAQAQGLKESGETLADLEWQERGQLAYAALLKHYTAKVSPAQVTAYYSNHPSEFATAASRNAHVLRVGSEAQAQAAQKALTSGTSWTKVVKKYEPGTTASNAGMLTGITNSATSSVEAAVRKAVFSAPMNKVIGPIHGALGYYVVEVTKATPASKTPLNATTKQEILSSLKQAAESKAEAQVAAQAKKDFGADTNCANGYGVKTYCANYNSSKPAPIQTAGVSTSASTGSTAKQTSTGAAKSSKSKKK